jgi:hypothetical protein
MVKTVWLSMPGLLSLSRAWLENRSISISKNNAEKRRINRTTNVGTGRRAVPCPWQRVRLPGRQHNTDG